MHACLVSDSMTAEPHQRIGKLLRAKAYVRRRLVWFACNLSMAKFCSPYMMTNMSCLSNRHTHMGSAAVNPLAWVDRNQQVHNTHTCFSNSRYDTILYRGTMKHRTSVVNDTTL